MRIRALIIRVVRQFLRDKRTLALMLVAPLLILTLMNLVFNGDTYIPKIAAVDVPDQIAEKLESMNAEITLLSLDEAEQLLNEGKLDGIFRLDGMQPRITLEGSDPAKNKAVLLFLQTAMQQLQPSAIALQPEITYLHGSEDLVSFDWFGPVLIGVFAFFFVFLIAGISFLRERTGGTLERILSSPLKGYEIVIGYVCGFGIFTLLQAGLIAWYSIDILGMLMVGSFGYVLLITALLSISALSLGIMLSSFATNEFQMIQFIPLVIVPQVFFCGLFPMDTLHEWLRWIPDVMPLTYGADALREVMVKGGGWQAIAYDIYILVGFSLLFMTLNLLALKKYRSI